MPDELARRATSAQIVELIAFFELETQLEAEREKDKVKPAP